MGEFDDWPVAARLDRGVRLHRSTVTVIDRAEGYREFRCTPPWFSQDPTYPGPVLTEVVDLHYGDDPDALGIYSDIWSGSLAALRLRCTPAERIDLRERHVLASRTYAGLNIPPGWLSRSRPAADDGSDGSDGLVTAVQRGSTGEVPKRQGSNRQGSMWHQLGMGLTTITSVVSGWDMTMRDPDAEPELALPAGPTAGRWFRWSTLRAWPRWRRGQEVADQAVSAEVELAIFVSHRWETLDHPDPTGEQFRTLMCGLSVALASAVVLRDPSRHVSESGLPELMGRYFGERFGTRWRRGLRPWARHVIAAARRATDPRELAAFLADADPAPLGEAVLGEVVLGEAVLGKAPLDPAPLGSPSLSKAASERLGRLRDSVIVWFDYSSMPQEPRTDPEEHAFRAELARLGDVQRGATTVVLQPGRDYLGRGWCFFEFAAALRGRLVELRAEPGSSLRTGSALLDWATRTDQLVGALATLGPAGIRHSGLRVADPRDLLPVGELIAALPALGVVRSDDSDMVGGALPYPRVTGGWVVEAGYTEPPPPAAATVAPLPDPGRLPESGLLTPTSRTAAGCEALAGAVGLWCFATTRTLTLAWAARATEIWQLVRGHPLLQPYVRTAEPGLGVRTAEPDVRSAAPEPAIAAAWTDVWNVADDGEGWTRVIPSTVQLLVIVTQDWVTRRCRIRQAVLNSHLAAGIPVAVLHPADGTLLVHDPAGRRRTPAEHLDVFARPRMRRDTCSRGSLFLDPAEPVGRMDVVTALRGDPRDRELTMERIRASADAHPEWGFDPSLSDHDLLDAWSLHDLRMRVPQPE